MADLSPFPIPREPRQTAVLSGNGGATYGPFTFKIFDAADVTVWRQVTASALYEIVPVLVSKVSGAAFDFFTITFGAIQPSTVRFVVQAARIHERSTGVRSGTRVDTSALEKELTKQGVTLQELRRDISRALTVEFGLTPPVMKAVADGHVLLADGGQLVEGPSADAIASAQSYAEQAQDAWQAISDLTSSRHAIKLDRLTVAGQLDYVLDTPVPGLLPHAMVHVHLQGVLQPKNGIAYTVITGGSVLRLSQDPGAGLTLYVESAATFANPPPVDMDAIEALATDTATGVVLDIVTDTVRDIMVREHSRMSLLSRVTDLAAPEWGGFFAQAAYDMNNASSGRGGIIDCPLMDMPVNEVPPFTYNGIVFEGPSWPYWEGESLGARIVGIGDGDIFTVGNDGTDTESFTVRRIRFDMSAKTDGSIYKLIRVRRVHINECAHRDPYNFGEVSGGIDILFERTHSEASRNLGLDIKGGVHRIDRVAFEDANFVGAGDETTITSAGPAVAISGDVHTVDAYGLKLVKAYQGLRVFADGGKAPQFITLTNLQLDYFKNEAIRIEAARDVKMSQVYTNTTQNGAAISLGAGVLGAQISQCGITGAAQSAIAFAGRSLSLSKVGMQDWSKGAPGTHQAIDLISGFDVADIEGCTFGKWPDEPNSGAGAGTRAVRINAGAGRAHIRSNWLASDLNATPILNNGSGTLTLGTNPTR